MKQLLRQHAVLTALALVMGWSATAHAQVDWTHYSSLPVLEAFFEEWTDGGGVSAPTVIRAEGDTLKMWYMGGDDDYFHTQIGYAWSLDGVSWTRHPANPVLLPEGDAPFAASPRVLADGDTLRMWYAEGDHRVPGFVIRYATSADGGATWDRHPDPVLTPGPAGTWNETIVLPGDVIKEGGVFKMWLSGGKGPIINSTSATAYSIGYATSPDGIAWTLYDDPATTEAPFHLSDPVLLHGSSNTDFDFRWALAASVRRTGGGGYELWYDGNQSRANPGAIGYATSPDGIAWTKDARNPVLTTDASSTNGLFQPSVLFYDGQYHMWLSEFDFDGPGGYASVRYATASVTVATEPGAGASEAAAMHPPYPNPTAAGASLTYRLKEAAHVTLTVYDLLGREVAQLVDGLRPAGEHTAGWDGRDAGGRSLSAGVYVVRLRTGDVTESRKVLLLR